MASRKYKFTPIMIFPIFLELVALAAIGCGAGIELATRADIGYMLITGGSAVGLIGAIIWGKFMKR